jgi:hypothetical protein
MKIMSVLNMEFYSLEVVTPDQQAIKATTDILDNIDRQEF